MHRNETAVGIIFDKKREQVLLVKRRDVPVWVLPGGGIEPNEIPEDGAIREVLEETGFEVIIRRKIAEYLPVNRLTRLTHVFECTVVGGEAKTGSESQEVRFFSVSSLPTYLPPPYPGWIQEALPLEQPLIRKKIEGVTYLVLLKFLFRYPRLVFLYLLTKIGIHFNR